MLMRLAKKPFVLIKLFKLQLIHSHKILYKLFPLNAVLFCDIYDP